MVTGLKAYVDWDGDGFYCTTAVTTDPVNLVPTPVSYYGLGYYALNSAAVTLAQELTAFGHTSLEVVSGTVTAAGVSVGRWASTPVDKIAVSASTQYTIGLWVKGITNWSGELVKVVVDDQAGNPLVNQNASLTGSWAQLSYTFTTGGSATHIKVDVKRTITTADVTYRVGGFVLSLGASVSANFNAGTPSLYDNISSYVLDAKWGSGRAERDAAWYRTEIENLMPIEGSCNLVLKNNDRIWSPEYVSSPLYDTPFSNVRPGRRLRLDLEYATGTAVMWQGWLGDVNVGVGVGDQQVMFHAVQGLARLQNLPARLPVQQDKTADEIIELAISRLMSVPDTAHYWLLNAVGHSELNGTTWLYDGTEQVTTETGISSFVYSGDDWTEDTTVYDVVKQAVISERGVFWQGRDGAYNFKNRHYWPLQYAVGSSGTVVVDTAARDANYVYLQPTSRVEVTVYPRLLSGSNSTIWTLQQSFELFSQASRNFRARLNSVAGVKVGVLTLGDPTWAAEDEFGNDLTGNVSVTVFNEGGSVAIHVTNNAGVLATITSIIVIGQTITQYDEAVLEALDADTVANYGMSTKRVELSLVDNIDEAQYYADYLLRQVKDPRGLIRDLTFRERTTSTAAAMVSYSFGKLLTVSEFWTGGTADYFVVGEQFSWRGNALESKFVLLPADASTYWITDTSVLDTDTIPGY